MAIITNGGAGITASSTDTLTNKTLEAPTINNATFTGAQAGLEIKFGNNIVLEGTTDNAFEMTLSGGDPTADRTITLPDATGTVALTGNKLSVFAATTSSELAGVISDETGSGSLVFGTAPTLSGLILSDGSIILEGATANDFETTLTVTDPTADRTITFPDATGTVALTSDITVTASSSTTLSNKSISLTNNTVTGTTAEFNTALSDGDFATLAGSETLSNKTLTAPKFADLGFIADANGNELIILDTVTSAVNEVTLANAATGNAPTLTASGGDTNISLNLVPKGSGTVQAGGVDVVTTTGTQTLTNKTLTAFALTDGTIVDAIVKGLEEDVNVVASAATGTINIDVATASIWYYTSNATANHTLNFRYNSSNTLASKLATGDAITVVWLNTNGTTAYYPSTIQIDGTTVTPKVPAAISSGNASAIDAYSFTIIKTAATPTYTVLETQTKFA